MNDDFRRGLRKIADAFGKQEIIFDLVANLKHHSEDLVVELTAALGGGDQKAQAAAAFSLGHLFYVFWPDEIDASPSIPALLRLIDHDDPRVRFEAARSVAVLQVGRKRYLSEEQIVDIYVRCFDNNEATLKVEVAQQLAASGSSAPWVD